MVWDLNQVGIPGVECNDSDMWDIWLNTTRETAKAYLTSILADLYRATWDMSIDARIDKSIAGRAKHRHVYAGGAK